MFGRKKEKEENIPMNQQSALPFDVAMIEYKGNGGFGFLS